MSRPVLVGVVDSGFSRDQAHAVESAAAFVVESGTLLQRAADHDRLGHGCQTIGAIHRIAPQARLAVAQVFFDRLTTTPSQVAAAIHWLLEQRVDLINLSLGLRADRPALRAACAAALRAGVTLCAATPARGEPVYPAAYPGVLRMTGDARCGEREWSCLETRYADFGAFVRSPDGQVAGASIGSACLSGHIAAWLATGGADDGDAIRRHLRGQARYFGAERRTG